MSLLRDIIRKLPDGCTVLDPFMGSGAVGLACLQTGHPFTGIESDPTHYQTARRRLSAADGAGSLFAAAQPAIPGMGE